MILVAAIVAQDDRVAAPSCETIRSESSLPSTLAAITERGLLQLDLVQPKLGADIFEALIAHVAQHAQLGTVRGFDDHREIDPAVVIEINRGYAPAAHCVTDGQRHALETLAFYVAP